MAPVYVDGRLSTTLRGDAIVAEFIGILNKYVESHYTHVNDTPVKDEQPVTA